MGEDPCRSQWCIRASGLCFREIQGAIGVRGGGRGMLSSHRSRGTGRLPVVVTLGTWGVGVVVGVLFFRSVLGGRLHPYEVRHGQSWLRHRAVRTCRLRDWARFIATASTDVPEVALLFRVVDAEGASAATDTASLTYCAHGRVWALALPPLDRGWSYRYALVADGGGARFRIPPEGELRARFEGPVSSVLIVAHVVPTLASGVFLFVAVQAALRGLLGTCPLQRHRVWVLLAVLLFATGAIGVGVIVSDRALGAAWGGWPAGHDVTDTKSELIVVYWVGLLVCTVRKPRASAVGTLVGTIGTMVLYLLPHGGVT